MLLKATLGKRYALLDPILSELAREGRIRMKGEIITLFIISVMPIIDDLCGNLPNCVTDRN